MIGRYSVDEINDIWSDHNKYKMWGLLEKCHMHVIARGVKFPEIDITVGRIKEIEKETKHDVVAFLMYLCEHSDCDEFKRWLHYGLTSSDIVDTSFVLMLRESCYFLMDLIGEVGSSLHEFRRKFRGIKGAGRTHGQLAEEYSYQTKFSGYLNRMYEFQSDIRHELKTNLSYGKMSGALGDNKYITKKQEERIFREFEYQRNEQDIDRLQIYCLNPIMDPTQVIPRTLFAPIMHKLAMIASELEGLATQIRLLSRSECGELSEGFGDKQAGSSAMPHKRNPIFSENICGLARIVRSYVPVTLENIALWDERDISHSSTERIIFPDAFNVVCFMLRRMVDVLDNANIDKEAIKRNLEQCPDTQKEMNEQIVSGSQRFDIYSQLKG